MIFKPKIQDQTPFPILSLNKNINPNNNKISISITSWNVNGLSDPSNITDLLSYMYNNKVIYMIQEIHQPSEHVKKRINHAAPITFFKQGESHSSGVALTIPFSSSNLTIQPSTINLKDGNHRVIWSTIQWFDLTIQLVNIYAPVLTANERQTFFSNLLEQLRLCPHPIILGGDFNCCLDLQYDYK